MTLEIATQGDIDQIVVSSLSRAFVQKIYRHCWGKNNTPYFAGNCFKGVLYFDERLAIKYAEDVGFPWRGWLSAPKFHHRTGASLHGLSFTVRDAAGQRETSALGLALTEERPRLDGFLEGLGDDEVLAVLGAVDKGEMLFTLADFDGTFDADKLVIEVERFSDLYCDEAVVTGMRYDGRVMSMETGESRGKSMVDPLLIAHDGKLLDMYDFA